MYFYCSLIHEPNNVYESWLFIFFLLFVVRIPRLQPMLKSNTYTSLSTNSWQQNEKPTITSTGSTCLTVLCAVNASTVRECMTMFSETPVERYATWCTRIRWFYGRYRAAGRAGREWESGCARVYACVIKYNTRRFLWKKGNINTLTVRTVLFTEKQCSILHNLYLKIRIWKEYWISRHMIS